MAADEEKLIVRIEERVEVIIPDAAALPGSAGEHRLQEKYGKTIHIIAYYKHQVI
ncbi:MAG: hypothetical protein ACYDC3_16130 [Candidatus Binataceae bacterium]